MSKSASINGDALKRVLGQPAGRKVIWDLLAIGGLYHQPFAGEQTQMTAFHCGERNSALVLWAECMSASPELTAMMIKEQGDYDNREQPAIDTGDTDTRSNDSSDDSRDQDPGLGLDRGFRTEFGD